MYPEFAYSTTMQLILAAITVIFAFVFIYSIANLILEVYGENATTRRKGLFAFLVGPLFDIGWVYLCYFIGGKQPFSELAYLLIVTANPVFALLIYYIGIKVLKICPVRATKLMGYVYIYYVIIKSLSRLMNAIFFVQSPGPYNYMLDAFSRISFFFVFLGIYFITKSILKRHNYIIQIKTKLFINYKKEMCFYFVKALLIYGFTIGTHLLVSEAVAVNAFITLMLILSLVIAILGDLYNAVKNEAANNAVNINVLSQAISGKEDTSDWVNKMSENPLFVSMLMKKARFAKRLHVHTQISINIDVKHLYVDNVDACQIIDGLLEYAIKSAAVSKQKWVSLIVEPKDNKGKLFIINSSTAIPVNAGEIIFHGATSKKSQYGKRLEGVYKTLSKYENCILHLVYNNYQMSAYLEMKPHVTSRGCLNR